MLMGGWGGSVVVGVVVGGTPLSPNSCVTVRAKASNGLTRDCVPRCCDALHGMPAAVLPAAVLPAAVLPATNRLVRAVVRHTSRGSAALLGGRPWLTAGMGCECRGGILISAFRCASTAQRRCLRLTARRVHVLIVQPDGGRAGPDRPAAPPVGCSRANKSTTEHDAVAVRLLDPLVLPQVQRCPPRPVLIAMHSRSCRCIIPCPLIHADCVRFLDDAPPSTPRASTEQLGTSKPSGAPPPATRLPGCRLRSGRPESRRCGQSWRSAAMVCTVCWASSRCVWAHVRTCVGVKAMDGSCVCAPP